MAWRFGKRAPSIGDDDGEAAAYQAAVDAGDDVEAERLARSILERDPTIDVLWFDLALGAKRRRDWDEAVALNERALAAMVEVHEGEPAAWNLGIAATARGDWRRARRAWQIWGIAVADGDDPVVIDGLGVVPVRLNPTDSDLGQEPFEIDGEVHSPEVVWTERLSPAHARVVNVPSPGSGHRWGDIILTDGAPHGERFDGRTWVPVFDELALLERSTHRTWAVPVQALSPADSEQLTIAADAAGLAAEDWTAAIRMLCASCAEGRPRHQHTDTGTGWSSEREFGIAAPDEASARELLDHWVTTGASRAYGEVDRVC